MGDELRTVAIWPSASEPAAPIELAGVGQGFRSSRTPPRRRPVLHQGELFGAITVAKPPNDPLRPAEDKLIEDVASQAGLVLRNVRLIEELRASRQRLVKAQDEARRRLERNIHDGAQQQLVALAVKLDLAGPLVGRDPRAG